MSASAAATSPTTCRWTTSSPRSNPSPTWWWRGRPCSPAPTPPSRRSSRTSKSRSSTASSSPRARRSCTPSPSATVAKRAGLNPYQYTQVNIREQCSWTHTDDKAGATEKATRLVRAGIGRTRLTEPLEPIVVETVPKARRHRRRYHRPAGGARPGRDRPGGLPGGEGGRARRLGRQLSTRCTRTARTARELIDGLVEKIRSTPTSRSSRTPRWSSKSGSFGNYEVGIRVNRRAARRPSRCEAGSIIVATGFQSYQSPRGRIRLRPRRRAHPARVQTTGRRERRAAELQRQAGQEHRLHLLRGQPPAGRQRVLLALLLHGGGPRVAPGRRRARRGETEDRVRQYHLYRDIRSYGKYELLYNESREKGSLYLRFPDDEPPGGGR